MTTQASTVPSKGLLTPQDHTLILIDFQPQMFFATRSIDATLLRTNVALMARAGAGFGVPTILTTVTEESFSGRMIDEATGPFPGRRPIERTTVNAWEDRAVIDEINRIGRGRIVMAGLWTSICVVDPVLSALDQGFEVYVIADACGDVSDTAHDMAMHRMIQWGARPMTALQYLLELQRDWIRIETYQTTTDIARAFGGAYGVGIDYADTMLGGEPSHGQSAA